MSEEFADKTWKKKHTITVKQKFLLFSVVLFIIIITGGSAAFIFSMRQIVHTNKSNELVQMIEIERIGLESSVNGEIANALKMADSPLVIRYFQNPNDPDIEAMAFQEIQGYRRAFAGNTVFWVNDIDHKFYSDDAFAFYLDVDDPVNYWYLMTLNETERYNFNINYNPDLNVTNLWINAPVFDENHRPVGILGTGIDLSAFIESIYKRHKGNAKLYFFNEAGEITGANDSGLVAEKVTIEKELTGTGPEILAWAKNASIRAKDPNSSRNIVETFSGIEGEIAVGSVPALGWYAIVVHPLTFADYLKTTMAILFFAMMGLILLIFIIFNLFIRTFLRPLSGMITILDDISSDWDLRKRLEIHQGDEIGNLADFFNQTFDKIRGLIRSIKGKAFSLSDTGDELSANMDGTNVAIEKINAAIQEMREEVLAENDEVNLTAGSMEKIIVGLGKLNEHISVQAESVEQSSSAIEEMLANIHSVTETLIKNTTNITSLAESSGTGRSDLEKVSEDIQEIARESEGLLEINSVMENIASQTNLLAMNAAIEAAHAGELGKGFAVVADEIRKLAENSSEQSKTTSSVLQKIKASIDMITQSTAVVLERFGTIEREVEIVSNQETQIRSAMQEQETGSRNILEAISRLNAVTDQVQRASAEMNAETRDALKESEKLKVITAKVAGSMDEMTESVDQIISSVTRVKEISEENKQSISDLSFEIAKFKVE